MIEPAVERTKNVLFRPFRWARWWRIALIGMGTAVIGTANGCNMGGLNDVKEAFQKDPSAAEALRKLYEYISPAQLAGFITLLIASAVLLTLVHVYVNSVARFMMFDAMTTGNARIRQGWDKWHGQGVRLFGFQILLALFVTAVLSSLGYLFSVSGKTAQTDPGSFLLGFLAMMGATWVFSIAVVCVHQISVDFAVPVMALEAASLRDALGRVWAMAMAKPGEYALYLLMKLLLLMGISIALLIVEMVVLFIPLIVAAVLMVMMAKSLVGSPAVMVVAVGAGMAAIVGMMIFVVSLIAAPTYVFFQGYALEFFGDRYPRLHAALYPPAVTPGPAM